MPETDAPTVLTPAQRKLLNVLSDGVAHPYDELIACLWDGDDRALSVMICKLRKHLRPNGYDVLCVWEKRQRMYRMVRLMSSPYNGLK